MSIKVAMIGHGAVASIHAAQLASEPGVELVSVFGVNRGSAIRFASAYAIPHASETLGEAVSRADVAIVCSPTTAHFEQACECLDRGVHVLVELPPCERLEEAKELGELAKARRVRVQCAHTSRYLVPYSRIESSIRAGHLGPIQEVNYVRHHKLRDRKWIDNALLHHAAHPIDLWMTWFGGIVPLACVALPDIRNTQTVSLLGKLHDGAPATVSVTYASRLPHVRMLIVGDRHTVETDGFSYIRSDLEELQFSGKEQELYEKAIHDLDMEFLRSCQGESAGIDWQEAVKLIETVSRFRDLGTCLQGSG